MCAHRDKKNRFSFFNETSLRRWEASRALCEQSLFCREKGPTETMSISLVFLAHIFPPLHFACINTPSTRFAAPSLLSELLCDVCHLLIRVCVCLSVCGTVSSGIHTLEHASRLRLRKTPNPTKNEKRNQKKNHLTPCVLAQPKRKTRAIYFPKSSGTMRTHG